MGLYQNTFFLAAQAAVERNERGSATASTLFARILGQTVGTALFGGIVNLGLADRIGGNAVNQIMDPMLRQNFPAGRDRAADAGGRRCAASRLCGRRLGGARRFRGDVRIALGIEPDPPGAPGEVEVRGGTR